MRANRNDTQRHTTAILVAGIAQLNNTTVDTNHATQEKVKNRTAPGEGNIVVWCAIGDNGGGGEPCVCTPHTVQKQNSKRRYATTEK